MGNSISNGLSSHLIAAVIPPALSAVVGALSFRAPERKVLRSRHPAERVDRPVQSVRDPFRRLIQQDPPPGVTAPWEFDSAPGGAP